MKFRSIALAGVALAALSVPAAASDYTGWYLGLGAGYSRPLLVQVSTPSGASGVGTIPYHDGALATVSAGYKWDMNIRTELELGYTYHSAASGLGGGGVTTKSALFNVVYDLPIWEGLTWSIGGGIGAGAVMEDTGNFPRLVYGQHTGFMWQGITGLSASISPAVDLYVDYRFRSAEADADFSSQIAGLNPDPRATFSENVALVRHPLVSARISRRLRRRLPPPPPPRRRRPRRRRR